MAKLIWLYTDSVQFNYTMYSIHQLITVKPVIDQYIINKQTN